METSSFRLPKKTGTYADALSAVGLERLLDFLGAGEARIRDRGGFYELTAGCVKVDPGRNYRA